MVAIEYTTARSQGTGPCDPGLSHLAFPVWILELETTSQNPIKKSKLYFGSHSELSVQHAYIWPRPSVPPRRRVHVPNSKGWKVYMTLAWDSDGNGSSRLLTDARGGVANIRSDGVA